MRGSGEAYEGGANSDGIAGLLSAIVESSDDAIVSKTVEGIITSWNPAAERMFGFTAAEAIGKSIRIIIPPELQADEDYVLSKIQRGEKVDHFETVRQTKDGRRLDISLTISPVRNSQGVVIGASKIARNVTAQKQMEREREMALEQLAEALASRDEFIAVAAHELRNPLNVLMLLWRLMDRNENPNAWREGNFLARSRAQLARLSSLVDRLMDVARIRSGTFDLFREEFELDSLIREVAGRFSIGNPSIPLGLELEEQIVDCWDRVRIDQVITNLISNAIKFGQEKPIAIKAYRSGKEAVLAVRDEGVGIPPENHDRIFERFERFTTPARDEGLGMGLWISKRIVEAHSGTLTVESEPGKGSTFVVRLPLESRSDSEGHA